MNIVNAKHQINTKLIMESVSACFVTTRYWGSLRGTMSGTARHYDTLRDITSGTTSH